MSELDHQFVLEQWKKLYLVDAYEDWDVEVSPDVKQDFATIALFLDFKTSKSSGEEKEIFEGIKKASLIILDFLEIQIIDNPDVNEGSKFVDQTKMIFKHKFNNF